VLPDALPEDEGADEPPVEGPEEEGLLPVEEAPDLPPPADEATEADGEASEDAPE